MSQHPLSLIHRMIPARQPADGPAPALLLLHGRGADEQDLLGLAPYLDPRLTIVSARAPHRRSVGHHWYDLIAVGAPEPSSYATGREQLDRFVDEIVPHYDLDPARLYALGFSQGAMMTGGLLLTRPEGLAGAIMLSGYLPLGLGLPTREEAVAGAPVFLAHGVHDSVIPIRYGRQARDELTRLRADLTYREYPMDHMIAPDELSDIAAWLTARLDAPPRAAGHQDLATDASSSPS